MDTKKLDPLYGPEEALVWYREEVLGNFDDFDWDTYSDCPVRDGRAQTVGVPVQLHPRDFQPYLDGTGLIAHFDLDVPPGWTIDCISAHSIHEPPKLLSITVAGGERRLPGRPPNVWAATAHHDKRGVHARLLRELQQPATILAAAHFKIAREHPHLLPQQPLPERPKSHRGRPAYTDDHYELVAARAVIHHRRGVRNVTQAVAEDAERGLIRAAGRSRGAVKQWFAECREPQRGYLPQRTGGGQAKFAPGPRLTQEAINRADVLDGGDA